jgi:geranylgeranyl pyrophosphate synthase
MRDCGAESYVREKAEKLRVKAHDILMQFPDNEYRRRLLEMNSFLVNRDK